jgi:hypothetical protein
LISLQRAKCKTITPPALIARSKFKYRMSRNSLLGRNLD